MIIDKLAGLITAATGYRITDEHETCFATRVYPAKGTSWDRFKEVTVEYAKSVIEERKKRLEELADSVSDAVDELKDKINDND